MNRMNPKVDFYFNKAGKWQAEIEKLRMIVLDCQLTEKLKWGVPCYTFEGNNIVLIHTLIAKLWGEKLGQEKADCMSKNLSRDSID